VRRQVRTLRETANDFYEFTGGQRHRPERLVLGDLLAQVFELHRAWADGAGIVLSIEGRGGPLCVDRAKLERVLTNLTTNALQAMGQGGRLTARLSERGSGAEARVLLELEDSGPGLTETVRRHLFEPYFTTKGDGTGLGLAIAARILEDMGGKLELENRQDAGGQVLGARARIELPRDPEAAA
jgi:signal transduction histidine kinase